VANFEDLRDQSRIGVDIVHGIMSLKRFRFLLRRLRFDDMDVRNQRRKLDKRARVREIFALFVEKCTKMFFTVRMRNNRRANCQI